MSISERLEIDDYLGCIKYNDRMMFFMSDIADWILNYTKYDPIEVDENTEFRDGITNVLEDKKKHFLIYLSREEVSIVEIMKFFDSRNAEQKLVLQFYIDFDSNIYTHCFADISLEDYLPDNSWKGSYSNPIFDLTDDLMGVFRDNIDK